MASQFSADGQYFVQFSSDGKLKVWNTLSNKFEQEFTPDFHLTAPCTCLHFLVANQRSNQVTPKKKKRRESDFYGKCIALGTTSGVLMVYSIAEAKIDYTISGEAGQSINCLSTTEPDVLYSSLENNVAVWNLSKRNFQTKWVAGKEKITAILKLPSTNKLLTASKMIKLWDIDKKEVIKSFTGHSSDVSFLYYVKPNKNNDSYFISGAKGDRLLSCWNLKESLTEKTSVVSFLMEDIVQNVSINVSEDGSTNMAVVVRSGVVHVYQHTLNGRYGKPVKPKTTIQVVSDTGQANGLVVPIRIIGVIHRDNSTLCIGHGNDIALTFENISIQTYKKLECLVRTEPNTVKKVSDAKGKDGEETLVQDQINYVTPTTETVKNKRKNGIPIEMSMEKRLENLGLNKTDEKSVPKSNNMAQLLIQGLHSNDKSILKTVLYRKDENIIRNTVKRLPVPALIPLITELKSYIRGKTMWSQVGSLWLRHILELHAGVLISNPDLSELLTPALVSIQNRLSLYTPLISLKGRLNLISSQRSTMSSESVEQNEPLLMYSDNESVDSDADGMEMMDVHSESEVEWMDQSDEEENNGTKEDDGKSDDSSE